MSECVSAPRRDRGFIMVALLVGIAVTAVWMGSLLPAWHQQAIREKEENLVFYGNQYARAVALYRAKNNCQLPGDVDVLMSGHYLRKKWKDPITGKDFLPVMVGGAASPSGASGSAPGSAGGNRGTPGSIPASQNGVPIQGGARGATGGAAPAGGGAPAQGGAPGRNGGGTPVNLQGGGSPGLALVGMAGVQSTSSDTSIRLLNGVQQYNQWPFTYAQVEQSQAFPNLRRCTPPGQGGPGQNLNPGGTPGRNGPNGGAPGAAGGPGGGGPGRAGGPGGPGADRQTGGGGPLPPGAGRGRGNH